MAITSLVETRDYLKRRLGGPTVRLEVTDDQINDAIDDATRLFNRYMMTVQSVLLTEQTDSVVIDLPAGVNGVYFVRLLRPASYRSAARMNIFEVMYRMVYPSLPVGEWYLMRSIYEMYQRVRGTEADWYYDETNGQLFVDCVSGPYDIFYALARDFTFEGVLSAGRRNREQAEFITTALAYTKERLANVRGKFSATLPVPGGNLTTDADKLAAESRADLDKIELSLKKRCRARYLPMWG